MKGVTYGVDITTEIGIESLELGNPLILIYGTLNFPHSGCVRRLTGAYSLGLLLTVGQSMIKFNLKKTNLGILSYKDRIDSLLQIVGVALVFLGGLCKKKRNDIAKISAGYFMVRPNCSRKSDDPNGFTSVRYFYRSKEISTLAIKEI